VLRRVAHRMIRRQFSLNYKWYLTTKQELGIALHLNNDEEGLKIESALAEVFLIISIASAVYTYWIAVKGKYTPSVLSFDQGAVLISSLFKSDINHKGRNTTSGNDQYTVKLCA